MGPDFFFGTEEVFFNDVFEPILQIQIHDKINLICDKPNICEIYIFKYWTKIANFETWTENQTD